MLILYKIIKGVLWSFLAITIIGIVVSFFLPSQAKVTREISINANINTVENYISDLKTWEYWSSLKDVDSSISVFYPNISKGYDARAIYRGKTSGELQLRITSFSQNSNFSYEISHKSKAQKVLGEFRYFENNNVTKLTKVYVMDLGWNPISKLFGLTIDKMLGAGLEKELKKIKQTLENNKKV